MAATDLEDIDESQLIGENGVVYLFQWLSTLEEQMRDPSMEYVKAKQTYLETVLFKALNSAEPYPSPGRALRNLLARCLVAVYTRGETRSLFDTLQKLLTVVVDLKTQEKETNKVAAYFCIGELMAAFGNQYMSFMADITAAAMKTFKSSSAPILRYHALIALRKSLGTARRAITDTISKDIVKNMKAGLADKALPVQRAAAEVLIALYSPREHNVTCAEVESIVAICTRSLDNVDQVTRHSLARLVGHMLAATQTERAVATSESLHKPATGNESTEHAASPATQVAARGTLYSIEEMLTQISVQFNKPNISRKVRIGLFAFYHSLLTNLGPTFVENHYAAIVEHLMTEIVSNPRNSSTRYETLLVRNLVRILLRELVGVRMLSEQGQIQAIRDLSKFYLKRWPAMMPGQVSPIPGVLSLILREVANLLQQLGNAPPPVQEAVAEPLMTLLGHPSHTVRVNASWALRCFCYSTPLRLPRTILVVVDMLQRDITAITSPAAPIDVNLRALGHAYGLAALVSIIPKRPLYVSYDISAKVLDIAVQLLKCAAEHDTRIAGVEVEIAWMLIAALMSLGSNFVRPHLPQMLVLWRNALPKPTNKDNALNGGRTAAEWMFLLHVRESALGAILCFLRHNHALVTLDVGRRIASVLSNALLFANTFTAHDTGGLAESPIPSLSKCLSLRSYEALLRRRAYQCFAALGLNIIPESMQSTLLRSTIDVFAGPDAYIGSSVQAAIASSSGTFTSVWQSLDGHGYGVTSIDISAFDSNAVDGIGKPLNRDTIEVAIDSMLRKPVIGAIEHDPLALCGGHALTADSQPIEPPTSTTSVVDRAIDLFAQLLPLQDLTLLSRTLTHLLESVNAVKVERNAGRKAAIAINVAISLVSALQYAYIRHSRQSRETLGAAQIAVPISLFLKDALGSTDPVLRLAASEGLGRLASLADTAFLASQIKWLVDQVVNNRDPHARAGFALAFGAIYGHVGGLAAGPLLKTTINVLLSLSSDPHPVVHFWALNALARVINAANLAYAPFVPSTLGLLLNVYTSGSHEAEGGSLSSANTSGDFPSYPVVCQIIDAIITVLGPDIQESSRTRSLVLNLVHEFSLEEDDGIRVEAIQCTQHLLMFAGAYIELPELVARFRQYLSSPRRLLKLASINALYQLVQKDALSMSRLGGDQLVEDLFGMLDDDSSVEGVRDVITSWLQQTVIFNPSAWIDLCQRIMSRTTASQQVTDAAIKPGFVHDDEGESLNMQDGRIRGKSRLTSRWRTQLFALQCLHAICSIVARSGRREHHDIPFARRAGIPTTGLLVSRLADLIKMAFTASTAYVIEIRLEGLVVLGDIIEVFATAPDPACEDSLLLEQHQAPITAALTPAFSTDSTPEILSSAIRICAMFVGSGIVKEVNRMGRILKLLTAALGQLTGTISLGEVEHLSPNASSMLRISTLSAWAELEQASDRHEYLRAIVDPYRGMLASLWIAALRDYASLRIDSEFLQDSPAAAVDSSYSNLGKEVLLPYYADAWPGILQAITTSIANGDPHIVLAMDGCKTMQDPQHGSHAAHVEPCAFFFVIFGLIYDALSNFPTSSSPTSHQNTVMAALQSLKYIIKPEFSGRALQESSIFDEFMSLCYRMAMTEPANVQTHLIEAIATFAITQGPASSSQPDDSTNSPQMHCLQICAHILHHSISCGHDKAIVGEVSDRIEMISAACQMFRKAMDSFQASERENLRAIAILLYSELLRDESSEIDLVGPTLPAVKSLLGLPPSNGSAMQQQFSQTVHGLLSTCLINLDIMRGRQGPICSKIIKNNLLTAVLVLTILPPDVKVAHGIIERCCSTIADCLMKLNETVIPAAHCAKTLILASKSENAIPRQCAKILIPFMIEYITKVASLMADGLILDFHISALAEIWKAFSMLFTSMAELQKEYLLGILLPAIALLLGTPHSTSFSLQATSQLMMLATSAPESFQKAAKKLDGATHDLLEQAILQAVLPTATSSTSFSNQPQISLRLFSI